MCHNWGQRPSIKTKGTPSVLLTTWKLQEFLGALYQEPEAEISIYFPYYVTLGFYLFHPSSQIC